MANWSFGQSLCVISNLIHFEKRIQVHDVFEMFLEIPYVRLFHVVMACLYFKGASQVQESLRL